MTIAGDTYSMGKVDLGSEIVRRVADYDTVSWELMFVADYDQVGISVAEH